MIGYAALLVAMLFGTGIYLMLSGNVQRIAIGFILLSNGVNLLVLAASGLPEGAVPPLLEKDAPPGAPIADPLAQAFILTAIVIGLGTASFLLALAASMHRETDSDELQPETTQ